MRRDPEWFIKSYLEWCQYESCNRQVNYSCEYGDESLPHLKYLVSGPPDPEKSKTLESIFAWNP